MSYKDEETLRELYHDQGYTIAEIGEEFGVGSGTIHYFLKKYDIETRQPPVSCVYTDEELLEWIDVFVDYYGLVPAHDDFKGENPFPEAETYRLHFGSWTEAVKEAGYTPRSER